MIKGLLGLGMIVLLFFLWESQKPNPKLDNPVYAQSSTVIYQGSLSYNFAQCANCHGIGYDGKGPEAASFAKKGIAVPGFTSAEADMQKTYLDYFRTISLASTVIPEHIYLNYTDRGRWAMAYFLYSLRTPPTEREEQRKIWSKLRLIDEEIIELYKENPRQAKLDYSHPIKVIRDKGKIPKLDSSRKPAVNVTASDSSAK